MRRSALGRSRVNTPRFRSSASLCSVTCCDQRFVEAAALPLWLPCAWRAGLRSSCVNVFATCWRSRGAVAELPFVVRP
jgi:hypothetical protein